MPRVSAGLRRHPAFLRCIGVGNLGCAEAGERVDEAETEGHALKCDSPTGDIVVTWTAAR